MPSLNFTTNRIGYTAADEAVLKKAVTLLTFMNAAESDEQAKRDTTSALVGVKALVKFVTEKRNGKPEAAKAATKE